MKAKICLLGIFVVATLAIAEPHAWVLKTGETVTGVARKFSSGIRGDDLDHEFLPGEPILPGVLMVY